MNATQEKAVGLVGGQTAQNSNFGKNYNSESVTQYPQLTDALASRITQCQHQATEVRERTMSDGRTQHIHQCVKCHRSVGAAVKKTGEVPAFDEANLRRIEAQLAEWRERKRSESEADRERERDEWREEYSAYLRSERWAKRRVRVLRRAANTCEGCNTAPATQVHHKTYDHVGDEFDFELVALCEPCHKRLHGVEK